MRVLITGANGFVGATLAEALLREGHAVRALVREGSGLGRLPSSAPGLELIRGDVTQPDSLAPALKQIDVVFHLAGVRRGTRRDDFMAVNAEGTRHVCRAMQRAGTRRLVLCGSLAASGPSSPQRPRVEEDPFAPIEWYGESKAEAERIAFAHRDAFEVAVARPARIIGPGDRENLTFAKLVSRGVLLSLTRGPRPLSLVDVRDVVDALRLLAHHPSAVGEPFFIAHPQTHTLESVQARMADALGLRARTVRLSPAALSAIAAAADALSTLTGRRLPLNRKLARQLLAPAWTCSTAKAERLLGFRAAHAVDDSIAQSARWYREAGWL